MSGRARGKQKATKASALTTEELRAELARREAAEEEEEDE